MELIQAELSLQLLEVLEKTVLGAYTKIQQIKKGNFYAIFNLSLII